MTKLQELHQHFNDNCPHHLDAFQCVNLTPDHDLRHELCQSNPATIDLLSDTLGRLGRTPPCQLFSPDELLNAIESLPGVRLGPNGLVHVEANDPSISVDDCRHYVSHDLIPQVVIKLNDALNGPITAEEIESMPSGTLDALYCLSLKVTHLIHS